MHKIVNGQRVELTPAETNQIDAEWHANMIAHLENEWVEKRQKAYGTWQEQLDFIVNNGIDAYIARNKKIKQDIPKPTV